MTTASSICTGPVFDMVREQFHTVDDYLGIPAGERDRLPYPRRAITVSIPVHMDDGSEKFFQGYRVRHHLSFGPTKGARGIRRSSTSARWRRKACWSREAVCDPAALLTMSCDVLVPAAMERAITGGSAGALQCRILAEGANGPSTPEADRVLRSRRGDGDRRAESA